MHSKKLIYTIILLTICLIFVMCRSGSQLPEYTPTTISQAMTTTTLVTSTSTTTTTTSTTTTNASWQIEIVDSYSTSILGTGIHTSLKLDSNDNPHISYVEITSDNTAIGKLRYAYCNSSVWSKQVADSNDHAFSDTAIALTSDNKPMIAYQRWQTLKYLLLAKSDKSDGTGNWTTETIDGDSSTSDKNVKAGDYVSLAIDNSNNPKIAYYVKDERVGTKRHPRYASYDGSSWAITEIDLNEDETGNYISLKLDTITYYPRFVHYDAGSSKYRLKYTYCNSGCDQSSNWSSDIVETGGSFSTRVGEYCSLDFTSAGTPYVSYLKSESGYGKLRCSYKSGSWTNQYADNTVGKDIGYQSCLKIDSNGYPKIIYKDWDTGDVKYASYNGTSWTISTVISGGADYISLDLTKNTPKDLPRISYCSGGKLKYAKFTN